MESRRITLEQIDVPDPCPADWDQMAGGEQARFCRHCQKHVFNLSAMPRDEAERLVCEAAGSLCVRFYRDHRGRLLTLDYNHTGGGVRGGWRFWTGVGLAGALFSTLVSAASLRRSVCVQGAPRPAWPRAVPATLPTTLPATPVPGVTSTTGPAEAVDAAADSGDAPASPTLPER